jgi:hypothetical protein
MMDLALLILKLFKKISAFDILISVTIQNLTTLVI